jgi:hypothetical protein
MVKDKERCLPSVIYPLEELLLAFPSLAYRWRRTNSPLMARLSHLHFLIFASPQLTLLVVRSPIPINSRDDIYCSQASNKPAALQHPF